MLALAAAVVGSKVHLAQTGDCRLYVASERDGGFTPLTQDHEGSNLAERQRLYSLIIEERFAFFPPFPDPDSSRLWRPRLFRHVASHFVGGLVPTRAFGDWEYQPAVIHMPECLTVNLSEFARGELFALCSDGGNRYVEYTLGQVNGGAWELSLAQLAEITRARIDQPADDVTIIYFRVTH